MKAKDIRITVKVPGEIVPAFLASVKASYRTKQSWTIHAITEKLKTEAAK